MIFELILYYAGNQFKMAALNLMGLSLFFFLPFVHCYLYIYFCLLYGFN